MASGAANPTSGPELVGRTAVCLAVPQGVTGTGAVAEEVHAHHPDWLIGATWCGDPQLRPPLPEGVRWCDRGRDAAAGAAWEVRLASSRPHHAEWWRVLTSIREPLANGIERVVVLWVGSVAVLGPIDALTQGAITVVPHVLGPIDDDGCSPTEADLIAAGPFSSDVIAFSAATLPAIDWLLGVLDDDSVPVGQWLGRMARLFPVTEVDDERIGAGPWRWPEAPPALLDVPAYDTETAWVLDAALVRPGRVRIADSRARMESMRTAAPQLAGGRGPLCAPGRLEIDDTVRRLVAAAGGRLPSPWSEPAAFRGWLAPRYWPALQEARGDLRRAFPDPTGADAEAFRAWTATAFTADRVPFLLPPAVAERHAYRVDPARGSDGLNLVGYHGVDFSLGDVARRLTDGLRAAAVEVSTLAVTRSASPPLQDAPPPDDAIRFTASLAVVTADQFPLLRSDHPELFAATERMIGYWFWELEFIPQQMRAAVNLVDEIWAGSRFVADAFAAVARVPVRHVPIPVPEPMPSDRQRDSFRPLGSVGERTMFLVVFDHFSIAERKNPAGAIEAFCRAFAPDEGPVLVVKSMNAATRWPHHQKVVAAAGDRPDVILWDEHLSRADQMALVRSADCLVSLHRSEGLGLHLAEAMWLGTPCIATRYSGNLDFMDDECSVLVDAGRVHVTGGQGVYPPTATWADPDLDQAAAAMRHVAADEPLRHRLAFAARHRMAGQPTLADAGRLIRDLLAEGSGSQPG